MWIGCYLVCQWGLLLCLLGFVIAVVWLETQGRIQNFGTASVKYFRSLQLAKGLVDGNTWVSSDSWHLSLPESSGNILWGLAEKRPRKMAMRRVVGDDWLFIGMQQTEFETHLRCVTVRLVHVARFGRNWVVFWWRVCMLKNEILVVECTAFRNLDWVLVVIHTKTGTEI